MRSALRVRQQILASLGGGLVVVVGMACGGSTAPTEGDAAPPGTGGSGGAAGTAGSGTGADGGSAGSAATTGTGGSGAVGGSSGSGGTTGGTDPGTGGGTTTGGVGGSGGATGGSSGATGGSGGATGGSGGATGGSGGATGGSGGATGGSGGATGGTGGVTGGAGGVTGGTGGVTGGTGGVTGGAGGAGGATGGSGGATGGTGGTTGGAGGSAMIPDAGCPADAGPPEPTCDMPSLTGICFSPAALARYLKVDAGGGVCGPRTVCPPPSDLTSTFHCYQSIVGGGTAPDSNGQCCYFYLVDGRPFIVGGEARQATAVERTDWCGGRRGSDSRSGLGDGREATDDGLTALQRERLAAIWLADAMAEHASIASFARLTLQLLSLGAPPDLLAASQRATRDEIEHAELCFELASRYAGRALGPSRLPMQGAVADLSLAELAVAAVHEGCVGETTAAVFAGERLERADDPRVRAALGKIVEDETRHAELAWRTVAWAIDQGGDNVRRAVRAAFDDALSCHLAETVGEACVSADEALRAHGYADAVDMQRVKKVVTRDVLQPVCATLFARTIARTAPREEAATV